MGTQASFRTNPLFSAVSFSLHKSHSLCSFWELSSVPFVYYHVAKRIQGKKSRNVWGGCAIMQTRYHNRQDKDEQAAETADETVVPGTDWYGIKWFPVVVAHFLGLSAHLQILTQPNLPFLRFVYPDLWAPPEQVTWLCRLVAPSSEFPGTVRGTLYELFHLIFARTLWGKYCHNLHFMGNDN